MSKFFEVPHKRQPKSSVLCGPAAGAMIAAYDGERISVQRAASEYKITKEGVLPDQVGHFFLRRGYQVTLKLWPVGMEPRFRGVDSAIDPEKFSRTLRVQAGKKKKSDARTNARRLGRFVRAGGHVIYDYASIADFRREFRADRPVIININPAALLRKGRSSWGHFVVGVACERGMMYVNDPDESHAPTEYEAEEFMFSCHTWRGGTLLLRPPR